MNYGTRDQNACESQNSVLPLFKEEEQKTSSRPKPPSQNKCFERRRGTEDVKPGPPEGSHSRKSGKQALPEEAVHGVAPAE